MSDNCDKPPPVKKLRQSKLSFSPSSTKQSTEFGTLYQKLSDAVLKYGYSIRDVPKDGNCGLHVVVDQLRMQGITGWCVANLHQKAVDDINSRGLPDGFLDKAEYKDAADYMKRQRNSGTWCDEPLLRSICEVVGKAISITHDNGLQSILQPQSDPSNNDDAPLVVGLMTDCHYVSLQPLSAASQTNTIVHQVESRQDIEQPKTTEVANTEQVMSAARVEFSDSNDDTIQLPHCVSLLSWKAWTKSREWLFAENRKVYCKVCCEIHKTGFSSMKAVVGAKVKLNFVHGVTTDHLKKEHQAQRKKLLKKIDKHAGSQTHLVCVQIKQQASKGKLKEAVQKAQTVWDEANAEKLEATCKVFRAAYMCAKEEMAFAKHPAVIELNELNGCTKTSMLHSHHSCANILKHIAKEMRTELNNYIKTTVHPFSIMLDETTTVSTKSVLIVFIRIQVGDEVCNFLYDLVELSDGSTGAEIAKAVLGCFAELGDEILQARLIGVSSDGASVMTGQHEGALVHMRKSLQADFVSFHCLAHRLELAVHAAVRSSGEVQRLQLFTDALYTFYHRSYKNTYELYGVADGIHAELMRITQVFTVRWVFSSFRAVKAFISDYGSLCNHMTNCAEDSTRNSKDRAKCSGFAKKLRDWNFVAELLLLADVLEVLWTLSAYMQSRNASLLDAHPKIAVAMKTLKMLKQQPGVNLSLLITSEKCVSTFQDITLTTHDKDFERFDQSRKKFVQALLDNMDSRFPGDEMMTAATVLNPTMWPTDIDEKVLYGDCEVAKLAKDAGIPVSECVQQFREFKHNQRCKPKLIHQLTMRLRTYPVSTAECERGFSMLNRNQTPERNCLHVETLSCLLFIGVNGPPVGSFKPRKYCKSWLKSGHHSALDKPTGKQAKTVEPDIRHTLFGEH